MHFGWLASHESFQPEALVEQAVVAEEVGFDAVFGSDHFHPWVDDTSAAGFVWSWFGAVAARTDRIGLAPVVTCPIYRYHPALIAQAAATVDRLSNGRFFLGVGTGENVNEGPLGYRFGPYTDRMERMSEALHIMRGLLAGERVDFAGAHFRTEAAKLYSPPISDVPMLLAAGGPKSATFAAERADGLITSVRDPVRTKKTVIQPFLAAADVHGRIDLSIVATRWVVWAQDDDEAWEALANLRGLRVPGRLREIDPAVLRQRADDMDRADVLANYKVVSSVEAMIEVYRPLVTDLGATHVSIQVASNAPMETLRMVGRDVLPELRSLVPDNPMAFRY